MKHHRNLKNKTKKIVILQIATEYYRELYKKNVTTDENTQILVVVYDNINNEEIPCILRNEVDRAIKSQKKGKYSVGDSISNELLGGSCEVIIDTITYLFDKVLLVIILI